MSITASQIQELRKALKQGNVETLLEKYEIEFFLKEATKRGKVVFELENLNKTDKKIVSGTRIAENFCLHKDVWGGNFWVLTHIKTGVKFLCGKQSSIKKVCKDISEWENLGILEQAMCKHSLDVLKYVSDNVVEEYKNFYNSCKQF